MIVKTEKSDFESYLVDAANYKGTCNKVYFPENENELSSIVKAANNSNERLTISGARTGLNGGGVPHTGSLISLEKFNKIINIDPKLKRAVVEPGLLLSELQNEVENLGLFYPPDPTETNCSIGGTVANNASGARTFKYGSTRNYVERIKVVLPSGDLFEIKRGQYHFNDTNLQMTLSDGKNIFVKRPEYEMPRVKHSAGYYTKPKMDLIDLFIGAEGTLGIISEVELKLIDLPSKVLSMIVFFSEEKKLFEFLCEVKTKSNDSNDIVDFRELEFFDYHTLTLLKNDYPNIPENAKGAIWIEQEIDEANEDEVLGYIAEIIESFEGDTENLWFATNEKEKRSLVEFRHRISLLVNDLISSRGLIKVGTDTAVPDSRFSEYYYFTSNLILENNLNYVVYGHIGNSHLHFNILPKTEEELTNARRLYGEICKKAVELGGTISAEHGIGKLKVKYLLDMFGEEGILEMAKLKKSLDPNIILNIGNIFEEKFLHEVN